MKTLLIILTIFLYSCGEEIQDDYEYQDKCTETGLNCDLSYQYCSRDENYELVCKAKQGFCNTDNECSPRFRCVEEHICEKR